MKKKILIVFGTRPEAIKMAPVYKQFQLFQDNFDTRICVTAQHREMLDQVLNFFEMVPSYDLDLMKPQQNLHALTGEVLLGLKEVYEDFLPDYVLVHGDTTTSFAASLASYYLGIKVAHVEAGLRTFNKYAPFPEEINRQLTGRLADIHFAPTAIARENLMQEGVNESTILVTGNTVIDALLLALKKLETYEDAEISSLEKQLNPNKKWVLVTGHRRENFGEGFVDICQALLQLASEFPPEIEIVYPVHLNPNVQKPVYEILGGQNNIHLIEPLAYPAFVWVMNRSTFIITDSGGIQEEAPSLHKPVLVMRETTERPEALASGAVRLVGTSKERIVQEAQRLLTNEQHYKEMANTINPYGSGNAAEKIVSSFK